MEQFTDGTGQNLMVHDRELCKGTYCCIHNPSNHHMVKWPLYWRFDRQIFERIDPEGVGHPDPDDIEYHLKKGLDISVHGCNGLCHPVNFRKYLSDKNGDFNWKEEFKYFLDSNFNIWDEYKGRAENHWNMSFEKIPFYSPKDFAIDGFDWNDDFFIWNEINNSWWGYYNFWRDEVLTS